MKDTIHLIFITMEQTNVPANVPESSSKRPMAVIGGVIAVAVLAVMGKLMWKAPSRQTVTDGPSVPSPEPLPSVSNVPPPSGSAYKDGVFSADGSYQAPDGNQTIGVQVTLAGNGITDVVVTPQSQDGASARWQQTFADGVKAKVVGRRIDEVSLDSVSGSSLTPIGFNAAIERIKAQSKI